MMPARWWRVRTTPHNHSPHTAPHHALATLSATSSGQHIQCSAYMQLQCLQCCAHIIAYNIYTQHCSQPSTDLESSNWSDQKEWKDGGKQPAVALDIGEFAAVDRAAGAGGERSVGGFLTLHTRHPHPSAHLTKPTAATNIHPMLNPREQQCEEAKGSATSQSL